MDGLTHIEDLSVLKGMEQKNLAVRVVVSFLTGMFLGAIIGYIVSFMLGVWLVHLFKIPSFEGQSGFAVLFVVMIGIPVSAMAFAVTNVLLALSGWPRKMMIVEGVLALCSVGITAMLGFW